MVLAPRGLVKLLEENREPALRAVGGPPRLRATMAGGSMHAKRPSRSTMAMGDSRGEGRLVIGAPTMKRALYYLYERRLLTDVRSRALPQHLGMIQDGHRRYSREVGLGDLGEGYRLGATKTEAVLGWCLELGIPMVTLWWLSLENLHRDPDDVAAVLEVVEAKMGEWVTDGFAMRSGIRICPIGRLDLLPMSTLRALRQAEAATREHERMVLNVGVGYSGRQEIVDAVRGYLEESSARGASPEDVVGGLTPEAVEKYLYTYGCPDPDLIIRTSGEIRLSGFMLWQSAFSEFYFSDAYWPAFRKIDFLRAIRAFQQRQRRFGR